MEKQMFKEIMDSLQLHVDNCSAHLEGIITSDDLSDLSLKEFINLQSFCKQEEIDMTEIMMVDLYHVIGMGKLNRDQLKQFCDLIAKYGSYRSDIKAICKITTIEKLPGLPSKSRFTLKKLGNEIILESEARGNRDAITIIDDESGDTVGYYSEAVLKDKSNKVTLNTIELLGNIIKLKTEDAELAAKCVCSSAVGKKLISSAKSNLSYCGVIWEMADEDTIKGTIPNSGIRDAFRSKLKEKGGLLV